MSPLVIQQVSACFIVTSFLRVALVAVAPVAFAAAAPVAFAAAAPVALAADPAGPASRGAQAAQPVRLAPNTSAQIAHSALLSIEGTAGTDTLQLQIRRVSDRTPVSSDDVEVSIDGRNEPVTHRNGGSYELAINKFRGDGARDVEITVGHDGIREILAGRVEVAEAGTGDSLLHDHRQVAWWILNIVIVLIAAIVLSRRNG
jgi:hypothetical protein